MDSPKHFPLSSVSMELDAPGHVLGQRFSTEVVPLGQLLVESGRLAIGDPALGMVRGQNPFVAIHPGKYAVSVTRLVCLDRDNLSIPAYLSIAISSEGIDLRRTMQKQSTDSDGDYAISEGSLYELFLAETGEFIEMDEEEEVELLSISSGIVCMVDEEQFRQRMPDPAIPGGSWFHQMFEPGSKGNWLDLLDGEQHMEPGIANIELPGSPEDWNEAKKTTISLVQMTSPGDVRILVETHPQTDDMIAVHVDLGVARTLPRD